MPIPTWIEALRRSIGSCLLFHVMKICCRKKGSVQNSLHLTLFFGPAAQQATHHIHLLHDLLHLQIHKQHEHVHHHHLCNSQIWSPTQTPLQLPLPSLPLLHATTTIAFLKQHSLYIYGKSMLCLCVYAHPKVRLYYFTCFLYHN